MNEKTTILVADDSTAFLEALAIRLREAGYEVVVATDGYSALARAVERTPDLLLLDIHMPAGDGFSVQERKDRIEALRDVPVIYFTGDTSEHAKTIAEEQGAAALLHKPFEMDTLLDCIAAAIGDPVA